MNAEAAARAWVAAWTQAWRAKDSQPLAAVYADDVVFRSHPFREPQPPLEYAAWAFAEEEGDVEFWFGEPVVSGERAAVEYWAVVVENGELVSLAGTALLRFGRDGRVTDQHDYWAMNPGRTLPWDGWGR